MTAWNRWTLVRKSCREVADCSLIVPFAGEVRACAPWFRPFARPRYARRMVAGRRAPFHKRGILR